MSTETTVVKEALPTNVVVQGTNSDFAKKGDLPALTSLRFLAAAAILLSHLSGVLNVGVEALKDLALWQGVTCFFVLSGFILAYVHPNLEGDAEKNKFFVARIARIWPTHVASFLLFIAVCPISLAIPNAFLTAVLNLTMTHAWTIYRPVYNAFNTPSWSLSDEFFFYLCFPFLIAQIQKTWKWKLLGALALSLACVGLTMWSFYPFFPAYGSSIPPLINVNPLCRLFEFVVGITTYLAFERYRKSIKLSFSTATALEVFAFALALVAIALPRLWVTGDSTRSFEALRSWFCCGGSAPIFALVVFLLAIEKGAVSRFLALKPMVHLGKLSYSMYLYHYGVLLFIATHPLFMSFLPPWGTICAALFGITLVAELNFRFVETPFRSWIMSIYKSASQKNSVGLI